jgi:hypothetical protein
VSFVSQVTSCSSVSMISGRSFARSSFVQRKSFSELPPKPGTFGTMVDVIRASMFGCFGALLVRGDSDGSPDSRSLPREESLGIARIRASSWISRAMRFL